MCMTNCFREAARAKPMRCNLCGATDDIVLQNEYVGGVGLMPIPQCADRVACWTRWNAKHPTD